MRGGFIKSREIIALYRYSGRRGFTSVFKVDLGGNRGKGCTGEGRFSGREQKTGEQWVVPSPPITIYFVSDLTLDTYNEKCIIS
jgi:hypothetical protein